MSHEAAASTYDAIVVGGGLAGTNAALLLAESGRSVALFEAKRTLGGRASSYEDSATGEVVDLCQHVGMGCCTHLIEYCRRIGANDFFQRERTLTFIDAACRNHRLSAAPLPAPLHLAPSFLRLGYLTWRQKWKLVCSLFSLTRWHRKSGDEPMMFAWLQARGEPQPNIERFWSVVLVSALGDTLDRVGVAAARKVFVDGFMGHSTAYEMLLPSAPLRQIFHDRALETLGENGVDVRLDCPVAKIVMENGRAAGVRIANDVSIRSSAIVGAVPWRRWSGLIAGNAPNSQHILQTARQIKSSPITGVHLWYDRPLTELRHAVLLGRTSQWLFRPSDVATDDGAHYHQVVVSASGSLIERDRAGVIAEIDAELRSAFNAADARLMRWRMATERHAVFTPGPNSAEIRPAQRTATPGLYAAGDWTDCGWPSTMEGALRSGRMAAAAVLTDQECPPPPSLADLPRGLLARWICGAE